MQFDFGKSHQKMPCQTSVAVVYARPLASGRWSTISGSNDPATVGKAALHVLIGSEEKAGDETPLAEDLFDRLLPGDIQNLVHVVAKVNRLGELRADATPYESLGELILLKRQQDREAAKALREKIMSSAFAGLGQSTTQKLKDQLEGMDSIRKAIRQADLSTTNHVALTSPELFIPHQETTPMGRAASASEKVANQTADLVVKMSELSDTFILQVIPEWRQQLDEEKKTANQSNVQAVKNLEVAAKSLNTAQRTLKWTIGIAVVTMAIQVGQFMWAEVGVAEERTKQAETEKQRHEATLWVLKELLAAQQQVLTLQAKKAAPEQKK